MLHVFNVFFEVFLSCYEFDDFLCVVSSKNIRNFKE